MRTLCLTVLLAWTLAGVAYPQIEPSTFQPGPGGAPTQPNPDACWSEPPDLEGYLLSSEVFDEWGLQSEVANDFVLDGDRTVAKVRWWGGYYNNSLPCDPGMTPSGFHLRFYESNDEDCLPWIGDPYVEVFVSGTAGETLIGCQQEMFPLYVYETPVNIPLADATRYWLSVQMADHDFPPQWGRLSAGVVGCESAFFIDWLWPEWVPVYELTGIHLDMSQEFECDEPVAAQDRSWGRIKGLYR